MPAGRPAKYKNVEELEAKIDDYFNSRTEEKPPTITGLVLHLGFCDRASFYDYERNGEFSHTMKKARSRIEECYESNLSKGNAAGSIFALKNFGWRDKVENEISGPDGGPIENKWTVEIVEPE